MKRVGLRAFKDQATTLIAEEKALVIEKRGKPVDSYVPLPHKDKATRALPAQLEQTIEGILQRTGLSRVELEVAWEARS